MIGAAPTTKNSLAQSVSSAEVEKLSFRVTFGAQTSERAYPMSLVPISGRELRSEVSNAEARILAFSFWWCLFFLISLIYKDNTCWAENSNTGKEYKKEGEKWTQFCHRDNIFLYFNNYISTSLLLPLSAYRHLDQIILDKWGHIACNLYLAECHWQAFGQTMVGERDWHPCRQLESLWGRRLSGQWWPCLCIHQRLRCTLEPFQGEYQCSKES